jgi:hypothetical protein
MVVLWHLKKNIPMTEQNKYVEIKFHAFLYLALGRGDPTGSHYDNVHLLRWEFAQDTEQL